MDEEVTFVNWKPSQKKPNIVQSQWRKEQIGNNYNQQPGLDGIRKIQSYLKKKVPDAEIMQAFGISAETLIAIKLDKYDPVSGISLDNQSKIYKEFKIINDKLESLTGAINFIGRALFIDKQDKIAFRQSFQKQMEIPEITRRDEEE